MKTRVAEPLDELSVSARSLKPGVRVTSPHSLHLTLATLYLQLPGCRSLKEKRGRLAPLLAGLRRKFALAAAEVDAQDAWSSSVVACAVVSTDVTHNQRVLQAALEWIQSHQTDVEVSSTTVEER
jgi:uncharacterized protein YlxP (DUF503 family)